jgi:hypothetical protein
MNKVVYEIAAEAIAAGKYKLVYEKAGKFFGSVSGIPDASDCPLVIEPVAKVPVIELPAEEPTVAQEPATEKTEATAEESEPAASEPAETEAAVEEPVKASTSRRTRKAAKESEAAVEE